MNSSNDGVRLWTKWSKWSGVSAVFAQIACTTNAGRKSAPSASNAKSEHFAI